MSTMGKAPRIAVSLGLAAAALAAAHSLAAPQQLLPPGMAPSYPPSSPSNPAPAPGTVQDWQQASGQIISAGSVDQGVDGTIAEWRRLQQSDALGFGAYASFITANPGWPGEDRMRSLAERGINPMAYDPRQLVSFFAQFPPQTATGKARYAMALSALGRPAEARVAAQAAWTQGPLPIDAEQSLLGLFGSGFSADDYWKRADVVLWSGDTSAAERILAYLPPARRPIIEARIAMQRRSPDASMRVASADAWGLSDSGYLTDKSRWLKAAMNDGLGARTILANRRQLSTPAPLPEKWYEMLLTTARNAVTDGNWTMAYAIASRVDDAFPAGTDVSDTARGVRDDYTSLTWLAGTAALNRLGRPADAIGMFTRYAGGARSPQTISKGLYWAGRAATAAGRTGEAQGYFRRAAAYPDQFYGQLAAERIGMPIPLPATGRPVELSAADRNAFTNKSVVRAARRLGATGNWPDQTRMLRAIADNARTDRDHMLIADLSRSLSRPDLGVMAGRRALSDGLTGYADTSFPRVAVPTDHSQNWTIIHAISRQESQFDRQIMSHAGARGLMQLMPGTAQEQAGKIGMSYSLASLYEPQYNIRLGSSYFQRMLINYNGSYVLAVAAYNAGPGNVNKWLRANGDPRVPGADIVQWIEDIPIFETRNYVQRVLENAVVYDLFNPQASGVRAAAPLSRYLGKFTPG
ncbi:MAG: lytic transglycosylase domain-containing protein [Sphingobium sp.]